MPLASSSLHCQCQAPETTTISDSAQAAPYPPDTSRSQSQPLPSMLLQLHCATPTISPPAARPYHLHLHLHGASGALPHPARGLGHLPRVLFVGVGDPRADGAVCHVRRQVRYDEDDEEEGEEEWGHNEDVARMERYTEDARDQALLVKARVDDEVEVVLVFRVPDDTDLIIYYYNAVWHTGAVQFS
ncbi:uncharacterized protein LOC8062905 isoform X2 [Sorghum bicolor]|uniref:uncharacterized protein LOC8062905 isoform X2 n=1 Tax=Sorghum bicolor TaxID=4558 RepID=UPI000B4258A9|nr:uncharacterized protein LOC8062905 isoform X2 [Sorghum bicolor]|eukprot:XP_021309701.1 uncharacterized protein LOC8062905 isoform X2 [Sorghum bicolor]